MTTASIHPPPLLSRRVKPWRSWVRVIVKDLLFILIFLTAGEIALRHWAPEFRRNVYDEQFTGSRPMELNSLGYRGPLPPLPKKPGEWRILALGDSVTFGTELGVDETWPQQLAGQLRPDPSQTVTAINGGMAAADLNQLRFAYEQQWSNYSPDVVALVVTGNMVSLAWIRRHDPPALPHNGYLDEAIHKSPINRLLTPLRRTASGLCVSAFASLNCRVLLHATGVIDHDIPPDAPYGVLLSLGWKQGGLDPRLYAEAWHLFETDLQRLADSVSHRGGKLVVAFAPPRFLVTDSLRDNLEFVPRDRFSIDPIARFTEICNRSHIPCAPALDSLRQYRRQLQADEHRFAALYVPGDYTHFDRDGSAALAAALRECMQP